MCGAVTQISHAESAANDESLGPRRPGETPAHAKSGEGAQSALAALKRRMQEALPEPAPDAPQGQH